MKCSQIVIGQSASDPQVMTTNLLHRLWPIPSTGILKPWPLFGLNRFLLLCTRSRKLNACRKFELPCLQNSLRLVELFSSSGRADVWISVMSRSTGLVVRSTGIARPFESLSLKPKANPVHMHQCAAFPPSSTGFWSPLFESYGIRIAAPLSKRSMIKSRLVSRQVQVLAFSPSTSLASRSTPAATYEKIVRKRLVYS